jgi:hypothetical protein
MPHLTLNLRAARAKQFYVIAIEYLLRIAEPAETAVR